MFYLTVAVDHTSYCPTGQPSSVPTFPLGIYIHWPFCRSICPYCHFNRYLETPIHWPTWEKAFVEELSFWAQSMPMHLVHSVFFGGGTPSLMHPEWVYRVLQHVRRIWPTVSEWEVTLEMNPNEAEKAGDFVRAGVNRFSMGVQSFHAESLTLLGRSHTVNDLTRALSFLQESGAAYSFDMIYGHALHAQPDKWRADLESAVPWIKDHVSLYHLIYEQGTPFYKYRTDELSDNTMLHLDHIVRSTIEPLGLKQYEISNYAKSHARSTHNLIYWTYHDFLGIGPGAHGRMRTNGCGQAVPKWATENWGKPDVWLDAVNQKGNGHARCSVLTRNQCAEEHLLMSLRLTDGFLMRDLVTENESLSDAFCRHVDVCRKEKLMYDDTDRIRLTQRGQRVLNSVVSFLCQDPIVENASVDTCVGP